jgi:hypothetical protein
MSACFLPKYFYHSFRKVRKSTMSRLLTFHFQKIRRFAAVRMGTDYQTVLDYWFNELPPKARWASSPEVDQQVQDRFLDLHTSASKGIVCGSINRAVCIGTARYADTLVRGWPVMRMGGQVCV